MKSWVQILIILLIGTAFLLIMGANVKNYDNRQNSEQSVVNDNSY